MPQSWDRFFHFPSEGRHAKDFSGARKIQRLRPGLNPPTQVPEASMLTTRPPKPSHEDLSAFRTADDDARSAEIEPASLRFHSITSHANAPRRHFIRSWLACCNKSHAIWDIRVITVRLVSHCGLHARLGVLCCCRC